MISKVTTSVEYDTEETSYIDMSGNLLRNLIATINHLVNLGSDKLYMTDSTRGGIRNPKMQINDYDIKKIEFRVEKAGTAYVTYVPENFHANDTLIEIKNAKNLSDCLISIYPKFHRTTTQENEAKYINAINKVLNRVTMKVMVVDKSKKYNPNETPPMVKKDMLPNGWLSMPIINKIDFLLSVPGCFEYKESKVDRKVISRAISSDQIDNWIRSTDKFTRGDMHALVLELKRDPKNYDQAFLFVNKEYHLFLTEKEEIDFVARFDHLKTEHEKNEVIKQQEKDLKFYRGQNDRLRNVLNLKQN